MGLRKRLKGRKVGVENEERSQSSRRSGGMQDGNRMRNGSRERTGWGGERSKGRKREAVG